MATNALVQSEKNLAALLVANKEKFAQRFPRGISMPENRFIAAGLDCGRQNQALLKCSGPSWVKAMNQCAMLGLIPGSGIGGAYLVPYGTECTLIVGYQGLIDIAVRCGAVVMVEAHVVHKKDEFDYQLGDDPRVTHRPCWRDDPGVMLAVYCVMTLPDGHKQPEIMRKDQIDAIRNSSKAGKSGPWSQHYEEMARKTVIRRALKFVRKTPEAAVAFSNIDVDSGEIIDLGEAEIITPKKPKTQADQLMEHLETAARATAEAGEPSSADSQPEPEQEEPDKTNKDNRKSASSTTEEDVQPPEGAAPSPLSGETQYEGKHDEPPAEPAPPDGETPADAVGHVGRDDLGLAQQDWALVMYGPDAPQPVDEADPAYTHIGHVDHPGGQYAITKHQSTGALGCTCSHGKRGHNCKHKQEVARVVFEAGNEVPW